MARSLNRLGNWLVNIGRTGEGLELHRQALPLVEAEKDPAGVAETVDLLGVALGIHGDVVAAVEQLGRAVKDFGVLGDVRGLASSLSSFATFGAPLSAETSAAALRTLEETRRDGREALRLARQSASPPAEAFAHVALAQALNGFGALGDALEHGLAARHIADEIEHQQWQAGALCVLGESYVFALAPEDAIGLLTSGFALARQLRSGWWTGIAASYLALAYLLVGDNARARATLQAAWPREHVPANASERRVAWAWAELALADRDAEQALVDHPAPPRLGTRRYARTGNPLAPQAGRRGAVRPRALGGGAGHARTGSARRPRTAAAAGAVADPPRPGPPPARAPTYRRPPTPSVPRPGR